MTNLSQPFFQPKVRLGIGLILATTLCFACLDILAQYLTRRYPTPQLVWFRHMFHVLFLLAFVQIQSGTLSNIQGNLNLLRVGNLRWALIRGGILFSTTCINFFALKFMPVTEFTAINFVAPLLVTVMAVFILHEKVSRARWAAVSLGFIGVLVIMRPGQAGGFGWAALFPLTLALLYATFQVYTRKYAHHDNPLALLFFSGLVGAVLTSFVAPFNWHALPWIDWGLMMLLGAIGCLGHGFMIRAFAHAPAATLAPFFYAQLVFVTVLAWLILGQVPDHISLIGMAIIVSAGLLAAWLQSRESRNQHAANPTQDADDSLAPVPE